MDTLTIIFLIVSAQNHLPPNLLSSICYVESHHDPKAIHLDDGPEDSIGICQLHYSTAKLMGFKGSKRDLLNPQINIQFAGKYLSHQLKRYNGSIGKAVIAYNQGSAKRLITTKYQTKVFLEWRKH